MNRVLCLSLCLLTVSISTNIGPQGFRAFKNRYFVETGSYRGDGIQLALKSGFKEIRSIEYIKAKYDRVTRKFQNNPHVKIWHGDSGKDLWQMIEDIDEPITFWLDAHVYPPRNDGEKNCPLLEELEQIKWHSIKTHTILIDDMHCAGTEAFDWLTKDDLISKIKEINPAYVITYVPGGNRGEYPQNVMVAQVSK